MVKPITRLTKLRVVNWRAAFKVLVDAATAVREKRQKNGQIHDVFRMFPPALVVLSGSFPFR